MFEIEEYNDDDKVFEFDDYSLINKPREEVKKYFDNFPEPTKKYYVFLGIANLNINNSNYYMQNNTTAIIRIKNNQINETMLKDKDGKFYIKVKEKEMKKISIDKKTENKNNLSGDEIIKSLKLLTLQFLDQNELNNVLYLSYDSIITKDSIVFRVVKTSVVQRPISLKKEDINLDSNDNHALVEIEAIDTRFYNDVFQNFYNTFTEKIIPLKHNDIIIGFENRTLIGLGGIQVKGITEDKNHKSSQFKKMDVNLNKKLWPIKFSVNSIEEELILFAEWFNHDVVLPLSIAKEFDITKTALTNNWLNNGLSLSDFKYSVQGKTSIITKLVVSDRKLIEDMILLTFGFLTKWKDAERYELGIAGKGGKIKETYVIGYGDYKVYEFQNQDPASFIQDIYDAYATQRPDFINSNGRRQIVQGIIVALNNYIATTKLSFGKTKSRFNEAFLPWYLEKTNGIININKFSDVDSTNYDGNNSKKRIVLEFAGINRLTWKIKSCYFNEEFTAEYPLQGKSGINNSKFTSISNVIMLQTDRVISLPPLPDEIEKIDKSSNVGDVSTTTSQDLNYILLSPITKMDYSPTKIIENKTKEQWIDFVVPLAQLSSNKNNKSQYGYKWFEENGFKNKDTKINLQNFLINSMGKEDEDWRFKAGEDYSSSYLFNKVWGNWERKKDSPVYNRQPKYLTSLESTFISNITTEKVNTSGIYSRRSKLSYIVNNDSKIKKILTGKTNLDMNEISSKKHALIKDQINSKISEIYEWSGGVNINKNTSWDYAWSRDDLNDDGNYYWYIKRSASWPSELSLVNSNSVVKQEPDKSKQELYNRYWCNHRRAHETINNNPIIQIKKSTILSNFQSTKLLFNSEDIEKWIKTQIPLTESPSTKQYLSLLITHPDNIFSIQQIKVNQIWGRTMQLKSNGDIYDIDLDIWDETNTAHTIIVV